MAQDDRPYGGRIKVLFDGSVVWDVRNRFFPTQRDTDGEIEYAIRVVTPDRGVITSADGKCLVTVTQPPAADAKVAFLIVSGYDTLALPDDAIAVGKSYFITADAFGSDGSEAPMPKYDVTLTFDDYDLEYAGLQDDTDAPRLELCHVKYKRVRRILPGGGAPSGPGTSLATVAAITGVGKPNWWEARWASIKARGASEPDDPWLGPKVAGARSLGAWGLSAPETFQLMSHDTQHHSGASR